MNQKFLLLELNEFSPKLLFEAAACYGLKNVARMKIFHESSTFSSDTYDSGFLEPWVQWVSVHTGTPSGEHKVKHLGDIALLKQEQLWESLSHNGVTTGVWGVLNGGRGKADKCAFFLPDPWTFSEPGYPSEINSFLALPRYMARNYLRPNWLKIAGLGLQFFRFILSPRTLFATLTELPRVLYFYARYRGANFVPYSFAEYVSVLRFLDYKNKFQPQCSILFLNLIAHVQHYYWQNISLQDNVRLKYTMRFLDKVLGVLYSGLGPDEVLVVTNGLSQINTNHEEPWILYRQVDHSELLSAIGIPKVRVEACMTHDAHLFFENLTDCQRARSILEVAKIDGSPLFHVEAYEGDPCKLFYMIKFTQSVEENATFLANGTTFAFKIFFHPVVRRTGKHIGSGVVYSTKNFLPPKIENHELFHHLLKLASTRP